jgi:NDP-sugar pyrophosphorylase family protein
MFHHVRIGAPRRHARRQGDRAVIRHALVLTAGLGTRLRPLTDVRAKPAIPVAGEPMIRRIIRWLVSQGVDDLVLNLHHRPETLTSVVGDGRDLGARVRYSWEQPRILGSAGGPRLARGTIGASTFFIINGDTLTDVDLSGLADAHAESRALVTLALVPNREFMRYGGVRLDDERRLVGFSKRGPSSAGTSHYIGVQIVDGAVFDRVAAGETANSIGGVYDAMSSAHPGSVRGFPCDAEFWDVGTTADYWRTSEAFAAKGEPAIPSVGRGARIAPSARVTRSILWDDVDVGDEAVIEECIVTDGVHIAAGATYRHAVLVRSEEGGEPIASAFDTGIDR